VYHDKRRYFINLTHVDDPGLDEHGLISIKGRYSLSISDISEVKVYLHSIHLHETVLD
jgi:hypothetical protein